MPAAGSDDSSKDSNVVVESRPWLITHPSLHYPDEKLADPIRGHVLVEVIVDTSGRVEIPSTKVLSANDSAFIWPAIAAVLGARYCPGAIGGKRVRVRIQQPVNFSPPSR
jgi:TonB family protein